MAGKRRIYDIENNSYEIVKIGTQEWMAENLRTTRYNDGTPIPLVTSDTAWFMITNTPACTWYEDSASVYGALYNYYAVADTNSHNVCPVGWHVPTNADWMILFNHLGGFSVAGAKMKQTGLAHWNKPNILASNESSFTGLPGGLRTNGGPFVYIGQMGFWWSSTEGAFYYILSSYHDILDIESGFSREGVSVRCIRN